MGYVIDANVLKILVIVSCIWRTTLRSITMVGDALNGGSSELQCVNLAGQRWSAPVFLAYWPDKCVKCLA